MKRALLVFNPGSGSRDLERRQRIVGRLEQSFALEVHDLAQGEEARQVAADAVRRGVDVVVSAGGDGTVSGCASGLIGTRAALGIVPCGTSNSLARSLGLPTDVERACEVLCQEGERVIDTARVGDRYGVLHASVGFHADTIDTTSGESKAALGKLAYVIRGVARLTEFESFNVEVTTEQGRAEFRAMAMTFANLAPPDSIFSQGPAELIPDDGLIDLTIASADTALEAIAAGIQLAVSAVTGEEAKGEHVGWVRCQRAKVHADPPQKLLIDGDVVGTTPFELEVLPRSLRVRVGSTVS